MHFALRNELDKVVIVGEGSGFGAHSGGKRGFRGGSPDAVTSFIFFAKTRI